MTTHALAPVSEQPTAIWDAVARPPRTALKQINGGRLNGMTDVNPQWRYRAMTEVFGPCGQGWRYEIARTWTESGTEGQVLAFVEVRLFWRFAPDADWCGPIPGIGGSMLVTKERSGLHTNDEGFKMATTDALSVAMKMLGVAADIYAGLWDGSKYKEEAVKDMPTVTMPRRLSDARGVAGPAKQPESDDDDGMLALLEQSVAEANAKAESEPITPQQLKRLFAIAKEAGHAEDEVKAWLKTLGFASRKDVTVARYDEICRRLSSREPLEA